MFKKILVAIDGSEQSKKAEDYAIELAKNLKGDITAVTVVEIAAATVSTGSDMFYPQAFEIAMDLDAMKENSGKLLNEFTKKAKDEGLDIETSMKIGHVWTEIIDECEEKNCDLIVLGSKGLSGITRMLLGSVAENVTRHSKCPVLVVK